MDDTNTQTAGHAIRTDEAHIRDHLGETISKIVEDAPNAVRSA